MPSRIKCKRTFNIFLKNLPLQDHVSKHYDSGLYKWDKASQENIPHILNNRVKRGLVPSWLHN